MLIPRDGTGTFGSEDKGFEAFGDPTGNNGYAEFEIYDFKSQYSSKLIIHIQNLNQYGINNYTINESNGMTDVDGFNHTYLHCRVFDTQTNSYKYYRSFENSGTLKVTNYDFSNRIISCTFNCTVKNSVNLNDSIEIKSGRFDINVDTLPNTNFP